MFRRVCASSAARAALRAGAAGVASSRSLTYTPRTRDFRFLLEEVFDMYKHYDALPATDGDKITKELMDTLLEENARVATQVLFPLYESGDAEGCHLKDGNVTTPKGYKEAYKTYVEGGWNSLQAPVKYGGQGLPSSTVIFVRDIGCTANWPFGSYIALSVGAINTISHWASEELKTQYLPRLCSGEWSGTMCLTEPQCGTDLSQVKTRAEKGDNGTYKINGTKIFITAGDHDLTENIVHVVLARLPGSDPTTKGLSLFLVPRHVVQMDGSLAKEKNVKCIAIESKMGIKSSATCQLSFEDSVGYLIGGENEGMKQMFTFMNGARVGIALQGVAHAELAFQNGLRYARERGSQRALSGVKCPDKKQDPIVYHANVRHHILFAKAIAEGGRAMMMDVSRLLDVQLAEKDKAKAKALDEEIGLYTPVIKGCLTEWGVEAAYRCQQVWGGHGYIKGNGMEQIARDARIATLYEGTTAIQSNDFVGRKLFGRAAGAGPQLYAARVQALVARLSGAPAPLGAHAEKLGGYLQQWTEAIPKIAAASKADKDALGACAEDLLMYTGYITLSYYWLRMAEVAARKVAAGQDADGFYQAKLDTCTYVFERVLPRARAHYEVMLAPPTACSSKHESWDLN